MQPDHRPWAKLTLDRVVLGAIAVAAATLSAFVAAGGVLTKLLGLW